LNGKNKSSNISHISSFKEYKKTPFIIQRNFKILKRLSLDYKRGRVNLKIYPSIAINKVSHRFLFKRNLIMAKKLYKSGKKKINVIYKSTFPNDFKQSIKKIKQLSSGVFQIYIFNDEVNKCYYSVGTVVKIASEGIQKIALLTYLDDFNIFDGNENYHFYCTNSEQNYFLKILEESSGRSSIENRQEIFSIADNLGLFKLEINIFFNSLYKKIKDTLKGKENNIYIFEIPFNMLENLNYNRLTTIKIDNNTNYSLSLSGKSISMFFIPLNFENIENINNFQNKFINLENYIKFNKVSMAFGEIDKTENNQSNETLIKFRAGVEYGAVGSLIFLEGCYKQPIGINIGYTESSNLMLLINNTNLQAILRNYLSFSNDNLVL